MGSIVELPLQILTGSLGAIYQGSFELGSVELAGFFVEVVDMTLGSLF